MVQRNTKPVARAPQALAVSILAFLLYLPTAGYDFTFDDTVLVARNPVVQEPGAWRKALVEDYWPETQSGLYRPLTLLSFALERLVHGGSPGGHHVVNALLHAAVSCIIVAVAAEMIAGVWPAVLAGALFAFHPLRTEAVCGVVGRAELLSSLLALSVFLLWLRSRRRRQSRSLGRVAALFFLAVMAKENVIVLPLLLLMWEAQSSGEHRAGTWLAALRNRAVWYLAAVAAGALLLRAAVLGGFSASISANPPFVENPLVREPAGVRVISTLAIQGRALGLQLWPAPLLADYSFDTLVLARRWYHPAVLAFAGALAGASALWFSRRRLLRGVAFGLCWYLAALIPAMNLIVLVGTVFGERLLYFPSAGLCFACAFLVEPLLGRRESWPVPREASARIALAGALGLILACGAATLERMSVWRDNRALFEDVVAKAPRNVKARLWLGDTLVRAGEFAAGVREYEAALRIHPEYFPAAANLVVPLMSLGRYGDAVRAGERALALSSAPNVTLLYNIALAHEGSGDPVRFLSLMNEALAIEPDNVPVLTQLGRYHAAGGKNPGLARQYLERALAGTRDPDRAAGIRRILRTVAP